MTSLLDASHPVYCIGAGGHCKVVLDLLHCLNAQVAGYHDFQKAAWLENLGIPRISRMDVEQLSKKKAQFCMAFVGRSPEDLKKRYLEMESYQTLGACFPSIIHPHAVISSDVAFGSGVQVFAGTIVNAGASIHNAVILNTGSIVEHDVVIEQGSHLAPRATVLGGARIKEYAYLGAGCMIIQNRSVEAGSFIKSGTVFNG